MIGVKMKNQAELCNRNEPDLLDLSRAFSDMGIDFEDLSEYLEQFDSKAVVTDPVPIFPQPTETRLNYLKPGSREVLHRPYHIFDYLPPMYPDMEETENQPVNTQEDLKDIEGLITHTLDDLSDRNVKTIVTKVNEEDENRI